jgi:hypothetical protein
MTAQQLLSEHAIGEVLKRTVRPGRPEKKCGTGTHILETRIPEGITQDQCKLWKKVAAVPVARMEKYLAECVEKEDGHARRFGST